MQETTQDVSRFTGKSARTFERLKRIVARFRGREIPLSYMEMHSTATRFHPMSGPMRPSPGQVIEMSRGARYEVQPSGALVRLR